MNTSNAGSGALSVIIDGPSKVKMDCSECVEGYKIAYTPMAPGNYLISIKYGGPQHIVGSPFKARVTGNTHTYTNTEEMEKRRNERDVKCVCVSGVRLSGGHSLHETSSVLVESVSQSSRASAFSSKPSVSLPSDASRVVCQGAGLCRAFMNTQNMFTVDCSKAGNTHTHTFTVCLVRVAMCHYVFMLI